MIQRRGVINLRKSAEVQRRLSLKLKLKWVIKKINLVAGADCGYDKRKGEIGAVIVVCKIPDFEVVEISKEIRKVNIPYIPGYLNFREGPAFLKAFKKLHEKPDVTILDGNGIAHHRKMGIASYLGVILDICTIGCAKSPFFPFDMPREQRGAFTYYRNKRKEIVGVCLRTRSGIKPVFVSPGHRIDIDVSKKIILDCSHYRLPEPIRHAHGLASNLFR